MRFANVDSQKIGVILVVVIELNDVANLAPEGRSSKTAKDENERPSEVTFANTKMIGAVEGD